MSEPMEENAEIILERCRELVRNQEAEDAGLFLVTSSIVEAWWMKAIEQLHAVIKGESEDTSWND